MTGQPLELEIGAKRGEIIKLKQVMRAHKFSKFNRDDGPQFMSQDDAIHPPNFGVFRDAQEHMLIHCAVGAVQPKQGKVCLSRDSDGCSPTQIRSSGNSVYFLRLSVMLRLSSMLSNIKKTKTFR